MPGFGQSMGFPRGQASTNGGLSGKTGFHVPSNWGQWWRPKLAAGRNGNGKASVAILGDSVHDGWHFPTSWGTSWAGQLAAALQGANGSAGDGGSGFIGCANSQLYQNANGYGNFGAQHGAEANAVTLTAGWANGGAYIGPGMANIQSQTPNDTFTCTVRGSTVTVYYITQIGGGAGFTVTIDGVAQTPVANTTGPANTPAFVQYAGLSKGPHTVIVTNNTAGALFLILNGVSGENSAGVVLNNFSAGARTSANGAGANVPAWCGGPSYQTAADLLIYGLAINDAGGGVTQLAWLANVIAAINTIRTLFGTSHNMDVLFLQPTAGNDSSGILASFLQYLSEITGIADGYGAAVWNGFAVGAGNGAYLTSLNYFGTPTTPGIPGNDSTHPGDIGHALIYNSIGPLITATA